LEEDEQVQQWDQEEGKISATIQDLKQRQKTMSITEHLKGAQDMKKMQAELIAAQTQKHERQAADGTSSRERSTIDRAIGGGKEEHGESTGRGCNNDPGGDHNASIRSSHRKGPCRSKHEEGNLQTSSTV
jgi:hypothetical protein